MNNRVPNSRRCDESDQSTLHPIGALELSGRLESGVPPVVASFLIAEEFAPQLLAHRFAVAYQLQQYARPSKVVG